jgi:hypothetical protein
MTQGHPLNVVSTLQISNSILSDLYQLHNILEEVTN